MAHAFVGFLKGEFSQDHFLWDDVSGPFLALQALVSLKPEAGVSDPWPLRHLNHHPSCEALTISGPLPFSSQGRGSGIFLTANWEHEWLL